MAAAANGKQNFYVHIIRPTHYDDDGYPIQWFRAFVPSSTLACLCSLVEDVESRQALGPDVRIVTEAYDEAHTVVPTEKIIRRLRNENCRGVVLLAGVQTNQVPRAIDLARPFREAGIPVVLGGFHVSGCLAMLPRMTPELETMRQMGITLFAGEAEGRMDDMLRDAFHDRLPPIYNYLADLPELGGRPTPLLPLEVARRSMFYAPFDCGRGCPFQCSFCTIINVQGRKSRYRDADDVERIVRASLARGARRFFITDDNFARNKNWEPILDRLIWIRREENVHLKIVMQVDLLSHKIPGFIEKAAEAGCNRIFIGMESVNPVNLAAIGKVQNHVSEYRDMLMAWRARHVVTYAGYILGMPGDTPESIEQDIRFIQREVPVDILEFMMLTPLPGSADHKKLYDSGVALDGDLNRYDVEHVTAPHPRMTAEQWQSIYHRAWHLYYSPQHVETLLRRAAVCGGGIRHVAAAIMVYYGSYLFERVHPLQCGMLRRKVRSQRRPGLPRQNPVGFYARRAWEILSGAVGFGRYALQIDRLRRRIEAEPSLASYTDAALTPPSADAADKAA
jgi:radical SAM superfamily enzyme YgiQ (UPF0313 family)